MASVVKRYDKQISRNELLDAFRLFDTNGDGEVRELSKHEIYLQRIKTKLKHIFNELYRI